MSRKNSDNHQDTTEPAPAAAQHGPDLPYWLPSGSNWNGLPREIRDAVPRVLAPAYKKFVLEAPGELERSLGLTLVHLTWLEVCDQVRMALATADPTSMEAILSKPDELIGRHLNLITAKCQTAELLVKLRLVTEALNAPPAPGYGRGPGEGNSLSLAMSRDPAALTRLPFPIETYDAGV
jgi:hypothetical protein